MCPPIGWAGRGMTRPSLSTLVRAQLLYAVLSSAYLIASAVMQAQTGAPLSAANIPASLGLFALYGLCLLLPRFGKVAAYRITMIPALLFFGGGGVIGNVARFADSGLENYASLGAFCIAVLINLYGTVLNIIGALGWFKTAAD